MPRISTLCGRATSLPSRARATFLLPLDGVLVVARGEARARPGPANPDRAARRKLLVRRLNINLAAKAYMSLAYTDRDLDGTLTIFDESLAAVG